MKETKTYTAKDMEQYHSGELNAAQMHAVEKAALDDPFLADALEGYATTKTATPDLENIRQKLTYRVTEKKEGKIFGLESNWLRIAALFILLAGGGWLLMTTIFSTSNKDLTVTTEKEIAPVQSPIDRPADSVVDASPSQTDNAVAMQSENQSTKKMRQEAQAPTSTATPGYRKDKANDSMLAYKKEEGRTLFSTPSPTAITADSFSDALAKEANKPAVRRAAPNDTIKNFDVVMNRTDAGLDEVVVVGYGKKKSASQFKKMVMDTLEPARGRTNFDDYIAGNIKSPEELKMKPVNGEVELSFDVNKEGEPVNITVTKSLCEKCDSEAIRLLKQGPRWAKKKNKGKVKIKF